MVAQILRYTARPRVSQVVGIVIGIILIAQLFGVILVTKIKYKKQKNGCEKHPFLIYWCGALVVLPNNLTTRAKAKKSAPIIT